jgi:hypothetical protein
LILAHNFQRQGCQQGIELRGSTSNATPEKLREILLTIINATKLKSKTEKELVIKKYIKGINYSKEAIEVLVNYCSDGAENAAGEAASPAGVWSAANAGRNCSPTKEKTADFLSSAVRLPKMVAPRGIEPRSSA